CLMKTGWRSGSVLPDLCASLLNRGADGAGIRTAGATMSNGSGETPLVGARLRKARLAAGISQEELAERTGLSVRAISNLERGQTRRPYPHTLRVLTDALRIAGPSMDDTEPLGVAD